MVRPGRCFRDLIASYQASELITCRPCVSCRRSAVKPYMLRVYLQGLPTAEAEQRCLHSVTGLAVTVARPGLAHTML